MCVCGSNNHLLCSSKFLIVQTEMESASSAFCLAVDPPTTTTVAPDPCEFCPDGLDDPDRVLPTDDGATCGETKAFADMISADDTMCPTVQAAEAICCPPPTTTTTTTTTSTTTPPPEPSMSMHSKSSKTMFGKSAKHSKQKKTSVSPKTSKTHKNRELHYCTVLNIADALFIIPY